MGATDTEVETEATGVNGVIRKRVRKDRKACIYRNRVKVSPQKRKRAARTSKKPLFRSCSVAQLLPSEPLSTALALGAQIGQGSGRESRGRGCLGAAACS